MTVCDGSLICSGCGRPTPTGSVRVLNMVRELFDGKRNKSGWISVLTDLVEAEELIDSTFVDGELSWFYRALFRSQRESQVLEWARALLHTEGPFHHRMI